MKEKLKAIWHKSPSISRMFITFTIVTTIGMGFLAWKGPHIVKKMVIASLENKLAPFGIKDIEIDTINFGWWRLYLKDIHAKNSTSAPHLTIEEIDIALSPLLAVKAIDIIGATMTLKNFHPLFFSIDTWQEKFSHFATTLNKINNFKLPLIALKDCVLIIPTSANSLSIPLHAITETTVTRDRVFTLDWGLSEEQTFAGQLSLDTSKKGLTIDFHAKNLDFKNASYDINIPEVSLWASTASEEKKGYKIDGFAKVNHFSSPVHGSLKKPLEIELNGVGTYENFVLDELTIMTEDNADNMLELEGNYNFSKSSAQIILTAQIHRLSSLWDFTPLLAKHAKDRVTVDGNVTLSSEVSLDKGRFTTSALAMQIKGLTLVRDDLTLEEVTSKLVFNKLKPLMTESVQHLSIKKLAMMGINLNDVRVGLLFDSDGLLQIKHFKADTLGGSIKAYRFQRIKNSPTPLFHFETELNNIELADILKLTDLNGLSGQGRLQGNASMSYDMKEGFDVLQAQLNTITPSGKIQYKPKDEANQETFFDQKEVKMAFQVLDDLNFTVFNVRLNTTPTTKELQAIVKILGSNPNVLNGYPFEFNIVTTGKLKDLVTNTLQHMQPVPDLNVLNKGIKETKKEKAKKTKQKSKAAPKLKTTNTSLIKRHAVKSLKVANLRKKVKKLKSIRVTKVVKQKNRKVKHG